MGKRLDIKWWIIAAAILIVLVLIPATRAIIGTLVKTSVTFVIWILGLVIVMLILVWIIRKLNKD